jgi:hypothetical protein
MVKLEGRNAQMIARGFKPVAWAAAIGSAALGCYMLSLQVAAERAELAGIERRIVSAHQQIRSLQTELGTRGRLQQLEQWNAEVLALSAPVAGQFLESSLSLARFEVGPPPSPVENEVRMASAETVPTPPALAPQATPPTVRLASAPAQPATAPAAIAPAPQRPAVARASLNLPAATAAASAPARTAEPRRSASLLDDGTLRDLRSQSRSERGGGTRN